MRKVLLSLPLAFICIAGFSQNTIYDKTKVIQIKPAIAKADSTILTRIIIDKDDQEAYSIKLKYNGNLEEYTVKPLQYDSFSDGFIATFSKLTNETIDGSKTDLKMLFMDLLLHKSEETEAPLAGTIHLEDTINIGYLVELNRKLGNLTYKQTEIRGPNDPIFEDLISDSKPFIEKLIQDEKANLSNRKIRKEGRVESNTVVDSLYFKSKNAQIEFSEGYIRNISITGSIYKHGDSTKAIFKEAIFKNKIPIGFSSLQDYTDLKEMSLSFEGKLKHINVEIPVSYFICYHPNLRINTRDYCPEDGVLNVEHPGKDIRLYKEKAANILTARIYSDLLGFQQDNPNGVIQTEVEKRINLFTRRSKLCGKMNYGWFQYLKPYAVLSKVEKQNRYLELEDQQKEDTIKVNSLDLLKYEAFKVGTDVNMITLDGLTGKSTFCLDLGVAFSKVIVSDTTSVETAESNKSHINNLNLYSKAHIQFFPDERYGLKLSYQLNYYSPLNHEIDILPIKSKSNNKNWLQNMEMIAFLKTGDAGKLFFRYRLNSSLTNWDHNFAQVQLGYSFDITKQIK